MKQLVNESKYGAVLGTDIALSLFVLLYTAYYMLYRLFGDLWNASGPVYKLCQG